MSSTRLAVAVAMIAALALGPVLSLLSLAMARAQAQPVPDSPSRMRLDVETLTPRVVTADTPAVAVTGTVTNTGDRRIDDVRVQLLRGESLETERQLREAGTAPTEAARSSFVHVSGSLAPGQSAKVALTVPVRDGERSLRLDQPGVYPLLVNVNGRPEYSGMARLATMSVLLPVLAVPGGKATQPPADPSRLTVLWPLIDEQPRQIGTVGGRMLLTDDALATSLAPGGRLHALTAAVQQAATTNPALLGALCFAVDPDLLRTAVEMVNGYLVRGPAGQLGEGAGAAAAKAWLDRLRALTTGRCVITVPYADADVVALSGAGAVDLEKLALSGETLVSELLPRARPLSRVLWPAGGTLDQRTLFDLAAAGPTTVLADPANLRRPEGSGPYAIGGSTTTSAVPIDALVSSFLDSGSAPTAISPAVMPRQERSLSVQNGLAALTYRLAFAEPGAAAVRSVVIAPPRRWTAPASELGVLVQALGRLLGSGLATPLPLGELVSGGPRGTSTGLDYTGEDRASEIPQSVTAAVVRISTAQRDLVGAMEVDDRDRVDPNTLVTPFQYGLLRATSSAWRGRGDQADRAVAEVGAQFDALRAQVTVTNPGRPLTLASGNSPIPILLSNGLPVLVRVRVRVEETPGLRPEPISDVVIPARGSINVYLPTEVIRSGRFTVDVSLSTPGGTALGSTARLELTSTTYGMITLIVTGTAAGALFLLVGLRIYRRIRATRTAPAAGAPIEDGAD